MNPLALEALIRLNKRLHLLTEDLVDDTVDVEPEVVILGDNPTGRGVQK